jgi:hypothetical protein
MLPRAHRSHDQLLIHLREQASLYACGQVGLRNPEALVEDEEPQRPIEASLAQALAWGAPMWILDQDGPPAATDRQADRTSSAIRRIRTWIMRSGRE